MESVSIRDVSLSFGAVHVLEKLNLDVREGEFLVLLGPSGCGKSTLLNCIAGLLDVSDGQIFIKDRNVTWEQPKDRGIGMVFQSYALYPQMTVEGNLSFGLKNQRLPGDDIRARIDRASKILQIEPLLNRKPAQLSGGQRQRVAIGRALVRDVDVFLFDEPLSNLDAKLRSELRVEIKRLHQKLDNTMIYVTHDQIEALTLADRIAVMKGGVIQQLDEPLTIYNRPRNLFVAGFIGSPAMNFLAGAVVKSGHGHAFRAGGHEIALDGYEPDTAIVEAPDALLGVRPEHVEINREAGANGAVSFPATVDLEEPMGADSLVWISLGDQTLSARVESSRRFRRGDTVHVCFNIPMASLFDAKSEIRM
ncbi:ABC transporter ATP-binding protein [Oricola cellulosilytica]|uniref:ABC transporter ATP-binding protein n=1 Tax=Oricola cellulosilytica TaxID=1429082 RepID=A0A4R0PEP6_9HYPH|nr:ABC transporter ATP-binding protein [Oricola cellulosilytica]TCD14855.1 ABC transporter ATP-binding protein [Oricola cellulosilytica]